MVQGGGFEPPKLARQIYSLIPLATREPLRNSILPATIRSLHRPFPGRITSGQFAQTSAHAHRAADLPPTWRQTRLTFKPIKHRSGAQTPCGGRKNGAGERSRTPDRLITSQLLYQLSYASSTTRFSTTPSKERLKTWRRDSSESCPGKQHVNRNFVFYWHFYCFPAVFARRAPPNWPQPPGEWQPKFLYRTAR